MASISDVKAAADALVGKVDALDSAVGQLIAAYQAAKASGGISAAEQAALDAAVAEVQTANTAVTAEAANVTAALPPASAPPATPAP